MRVNPWNASMEVQFGTRNQAGWKEKPNGQERE
jgi:hypothetical protein